MHLLHSPAEVYQVLLLRASWSLLESLAGQASGHDEDNFLGGAQFQGSSRIMNLAENQMSYTPFPRRISW